MTEEVSFDTGKVKIILREDLAYTQFTNLCILDENGNERAIGFFEADGTFHITVGVTVMPLRGAKK